MTFTVTPLGLLPGGSYSHAYGISTGGGGVTVGQADDASSINRPVWWDAANVIHQLPATGPAVDAIATAITPDATVAVGRDGGLPCKWTNGPGSWTQVFLESAGSWIVNGVSADGNAVVGNDNGSQPVLWLGAAPVVTLPTLGGTTGDAICCNHDGTLIFGWATDASNDRYPVMWTGPTWFVTQMGTLPGFAGDLNVVNGSEFYGIITVGRVSNSVGAGFVARWYGTTLTVVGAEDIGATGCDQTGGAIATAGGIYVSGVFQSFPTLPGYDGPGGANAISSDGVTSAGAVVVIATALSEAAKWVWTGAAPPPFPFPPGPSMVKLNIDNVVVTSLTTESPCTVAQYTTPPSVSPAVGLRWSDTRGQTFGNAVAQALSDDPLSQLQWNRTGYARGRVFELFWSAAKKTALNGAFVEIEPWKS